MGSVQAVTLTGDLVALPEGEVERLRSRLHGDLVGVDDSAYDAARTVWNATVDKHPALIVRCAGVADVIDAVKFARESDLLVSVRCGGHNIAGKAVCEQGLMIDLSPMRGVHVDPIRRVARVEGGATLGRLDRETQAFGLATTVGVVSHTGVGGLTLGGGVGRLARKYGLSCDNLLSVDVVTAEGEFLKANAKENSDLFWGLRGGGVILASFEFRLHSIGTEVLRATTTYPLADAKQALQFFREFAPAAPDEVTAGAVFSTTKTGERVTLRKAGQQRVNRLVRELTHYMRLPVVVLSVREDLVSLRLNVDVVELPHLCGERRAKTQVRIQHTLSPVWRGNVACG